MTATPPTIRMWLAEPLAPECRTAIDRLARIDDVTRIAVLPDIHGASEGGSLGAGIVLATTRLLIPQAVGADIGCGMSTCRLNLSADAVPDEQTAMAILAAVRRTVPIIRHSHRAHPPLPHACGPHRLSEPLHNALARDGVIEFGTLGRGNHFLELQRDDDGALWLLVHSGSRAMGQLVTRHHLAQAVKQNGVGALDATTDPGRAYAADAAWAVDYAADAAWAVDYARLSREAMLDAAARAIGTALGVPVSADPPWGATHNSVTREHHGDEDLWVHRKGAAPAHAGLLNAIPGSMAAETFHVEGRGECESLCSSSHGAGRTHSRSEATRRTTTKELARQLRNVYTDPQQRPRLRDEGPAAYRDIRSVMRAQSDLVRITRRLRPILTFKGV
ncbi:MAG TPA: RtcB family protein [Phycisphaerales bacterium]|nr:RtcB family protein [Phycisphaerales bacterium]